MSKPCLTVYNCCVCVVESCETDNSTERERVVQLGQESVKSIVMKLEKVWLQPTKEVLVKCPQLELFGWLKNSRHRHSF